MSTAGTALITGASSGIGEAYARVLAAEGYDLIITSRREELLRGLADQLEKEYGIKVTVLTADLSDSVGIDDFVGKAADFRVDLLVHSAGFGTRGLFSDVDARKSRAMVTLHTLAATMLTRTFLPGMLERGRGGIVFVSSLGAFLTTAEYVVYSATKAYLNTFITGLADETVPFGVHVQSICPGLTKTGFMSTGEYAGFDYSAVPEWAWMSPEKVARVSLQKLGKSRPVLVPGFGNRVFLGMMGLPLFGRIVRGAMSRASRKRILRGEQALF